MNWPTVKPTDLRRINRSAILELVRRRSPLSRSEIRRTLGISLPTVMRIVDGLIAEGFVRSTGEMESSGGRRRELLEFNKDGYCVIGVDLGGTNMFGALANLGGEIVHEINFPDHATQNDDSLEMLAALIEQLVALVQPNGNRLRGIAVGVPGVTHHQTGIVEWAPSLNWRQFPLKERLEDRLRQPVLVENDVNLAVLGEHWFGASQNAANMVLISIGTGVGAGIMTDGALYRGHSESAGEVGYLVPSREMLGRTYPHFGPLESLASGTAIGERAAQVLGLAPDASNAPTAQDVFAAARRGEGWAIEVVAEAADYLAIAVADVSAMLDPEVIVLGGGVAASADLLIGPIVERIRGIVPRVPRIEASTLGRRAAVMGCIALVLHVTTDALAVGRMW